MKTKTIVAMGSFLLFFSLYGMGKVLAAPNPNSLPHLFISQHTLGGVPNSHAAFFHFFNQEADPVARRISIIDSFQGPVELNPGESAFTTLGWFMFLVDHCEGQVVREVIDFDSPQCQIPDADPDTQLNAITSLPDECLGPPSADPCQVFDDPLHFDFATSMLKARDTLKNEIGIAFQLDGVSLNASEITKPFSYTLPLNGNPDDASVCRDDLHYSPIYAYFFYGISIPPQTGTCIGKTAGATVTPLTVGTHDLDLIINVGDQENLFPVTIIQH
jgi:hypothetical protein